MRAARMARMGMQSAIAIGAAALCVATLGCHRVDYSAMGMGADAVAPQSLPQSHPSSQPPTDAATAPQPAPNSEASSANAAETPNNANNAATTANAAADADLAAYCRNLRDSSDPFFGTRQRERLLAELRSPTYDTDSWRISITRELARDHLRFGDADAAISLLSGALAMERRRGREHGGGVGREAALLKDLAIANLKMGELRNCVSPDGRLMCALPLDPSRAHEDAAGSEAAITHLTALLDMDPDNIAAAWLLNIAHMTLGSYPNGVSERFRVNPAAFQSEYDIGGFDEIAPLAGLYAVSAAGGSVIEDFDNDGLLDIMASTWDPCEPVAYYRNTGDGRFADITESAGLQGQLGGLNIMQTDYNNDGWMDALIMRGGWMGKRGQMRRSLLRNNGDNTFTDVTAAAGLARPAHPSQSAAWADYDVDGDLDLFSCSESIPEGPKDASEGGDESAATLFPSQLFRNDGGRFTDVAATSGVQNRRFCKGSAWGDYDDDGDPDLYISNFGDANRLYRNDGGGRFTDVAAALGVTEPRDSFATWFWDYDNDGGLDLFVAGYSENIEDAARGYMGIDGGGARPKLYRNDGRGGFIDATRQAGIDRPHLAMGANFGDLDNDGFLDFYLGTGAPSYGAIAPNRMYRNDGRGRFQDVTHSGGFGHLQKGHGVSFGDLDRDGDQDIFAQVGGFYPGDGFVNALYRNPGHSNRWLSVKLIGVESNAAAVGARLKLTLETRGGAARTIYAHVSGGGGFGASTLTQELGLGRARRIAALEVRWPTGAVQRFEDVPLDSRLRIREGADEYEILRLPPTPLGALPAGR